jgi:hypothetical protein
MINFTPLRTKRFTAELQELSISSAITLCNMRPDAYEAGTSYLLSQIVTNDINTRLLSVQERALIVAHYLAHTSEGTPDFAIGDAKFSDYLLDDKEYQDSVGLGELSGSVWRMRPLYGVYAESIERLMMIGKLERSRAGWWFGAMAAQMYRETEDLPDTENMTDVEIDEYVSVRADIFKLFPESEFVGMLMAFIDGQERLDHIFGLDFQDDGIVFKGKGELGLPPARFPYSNAVTEFTASIFGNAHKSGD